jgi:hypothetical protein
MKQIFKLLNIIISIIFLINIILASIFIDAFIEKDKLIQIMILSIVFFSEAYIIILLIKIFYTNPIRDLKYLIQKFYIGELK